MQTSGKTESPRAEGYFLEIPVATPRWRLDLRLWRWFFPPRPKRYNFDLSNPKSIMGWDLD